MAKARRVSRVSFPSSLGARLCAPLFRRFLRCAFDAPVPLSGLRYRHHDAAAGLSSGSDRYCDRWRRDYAVSGTEGLELHHLYRAMAFLGEPLADQAGASGFSPRCNKDLIEEDLFYIRRDLLSEIQR